MTFTPVNSRCPISYDKLKSKRVTHCINLETGDIKECVDEWRCARPYYSPFEAEWANASWTGWTEFEIEDERNLPVEEEPRGGAKRKAEEDQEAKLDEDEDEARGGVKRKAEEEGDEERMRREEERIRLRNQRSEVTSGSGVKRKAEEESNEERQRPHGANEDEMNEIRRGLHLMGFTLISLNGFLVQISMSLTSSTKSDAQYDFTAKASSKSMLM